MLRIIARELKESAPSWKRVRFGLGLASLLVGGGGCLGLDPISPDVGSDEDAGAMEAEIPRAPLATVTLEDGSYIDFVEIEGAIVMSASAEGDERLALEALSADHPVDPITLFEQISNEPAPAALVAARARVSSAADAGERDAAEPPPPSMEMMPEPERAVSQRGGYTISDGVMTASQFQYKYCSAASPSWFDFSACWTGRRGYYLSTMLPGDYVATSVNCTSGSLTHELFFWDSRQRKWRQGYWNPISRGWTSLFTTWGAYRTWYYVKIRANPSDTYHLALKIALF